MKAIGSEPLTTLARIRVRLAYMLSLPFLASTRQAATQDTVWMVN